MTLVGVTGMALAITHATETERLTQRSLSRLGTDGGAAGILNGTLVALGLILVALVMAVGGLGRTFDRLSIATPLISVGLFVAAYAGHLLPYAVMELISFAMIGAWLWLFEARLHRVISQR